MSNNMVIDLTSSSTVPSERSYSQLLSLTLLPPLPSPFICHHLNVFLKSLESQLHSPPTSPSQTPYPTTLPPLPHHLCSNCVQCYTGGSWVRRQTGSSGEWRESCYGPLTLLLLFLLHPPATACLMSAKSACHVAFLLPMLVLSLFLSKVALLGQSCSGLGSEDALARRI